MEDSRRGTLLCLIANAIQATIVQNLGSLVWKRPVRVRLALGLRPKLRWGRSCEGYQVCETLGYLEFYMFGYLICRGCGF
jgi:hypothetical protein